MKNGYGGWGMLRGLGLDGGVDKMRGLKGRLGMC